MKVESYNIFIGIFTIISLIAGAFCGVYFHSGDSNNMFIALIVGFIFLCIDYYLIEKREELYHGPRGHFDGIPNMKVESYNIFIGIFTILTLVAGAFCGVYFHSGESTPMFIALIIGFIFLCIDYSFIEKRNEIVHGGRVARF